MAVDEVTVDKAKRIVDFILVLSGSFLLGLAFREVANPWAVGMGFYSLAAGLKKW